MGDTNVLKSIIKIHIKSGNIVISDNWAGYNWLSNPSSGYYHHLHTHGMVILVLVLIVQVILNNYGLI